MQSLPDTVVKNFSAAFKHFIRQPDKNSRRPHGRDQAKEKSQSKDLDDDPSARAFDREKDIGGSSTITATQRRDMVKKAADFSSRFGKARYL